jgi:16S rRNA (cytosine1402-N4)-methyltransferase
MVYHYPVLLTETIHLLDIQPGKIYIDATLGNGGHTIEILKQGGIVHGFDSDPLNLKIATNRITELGLQKNFYPVNQNFNQINQYLEQNQLQVNGILFDLGLSSNQQKSQNRGFSFNDSESLDMRLDPKNQDLTAEEIINTYSKDQLYDIFSKIAQEKMSQPLIKRIISSRQRQPIKTGQQLSFIIKNYYQEKHLKTITDPSTKIFMALRIIVNQEYENLKVILDDSLKLPPGCIIAIITFHSGEDRLVKLFIKNHSVQSLTPKPVRPQFAEIRQNPLSRSATLRSYKIV